MAIHLTPEANPTVQEGTLYVDSATGEFNVAGRTVPHIIPGVLYPAVGGNDIHGTDIDTSHGSTYTYGTTHTDGRKYYYTDIKGSKPIKDPRIGGHFGSQRHKIRSPQLLEHETATHGFNCYSVDGREWMRISGTASTDIEEKYYGSGHMIALKNSTDFIEATGYFSDVNIIMETHGNYDSWTKQLNGGTASAGQSTVTADSPLTNRYVDSGSVLNLGLSATLGINTVRINAGADIYLSGIELIAQDTTSTANRSKIQIPSQNVVSYGKKFTVSGTPHYDPFNGFTSGSSVTSYIDTATSLGVEKWKNSSTYYRPYNGGRVVRWVDSSGVIKTSVTLMPPNARSIGNSSSLTNANAKANASVANDTFYPTMEAGAIDHSLSEVAKTFYWREFGNGSANEGTNGANYADASMLNTADDIAYVMDDGLTSLSADDVTTLTSPANALNLAADDKVYITFIGTGISVLSLNWDENAIAQQHIAQNLPYGTHILRIYRDSSNNSTILLDGVEVKGSTSTAPFKNPSEITFHQPKKPPIPEDAVILADYMLMADFVMTGEAGVGPISKGVRRQDGSRDVFYDHNTSFTGIGVHASASGGLRMSFGSSNASSKGELPAFCTNQIHYGYDVAGRYMTYKINGSTVTPTAKTGSADASFYNNTGHVQTLGLNTHSVSGTAQSSSAYVDCIDIVTPIHTSSHYQSFESPFLHELIGGDRNMEQTNLVVSPDGKTWDEVTRDTSYLGNIKLQTRTDTDVSYADYVIFDEWRGAYLDDSFSNMNKDFAIAYDRIICLKNGEYNISYHFGANGTVDQVLYVNSGAVSANADNSTSGATYETSINLSLSRGDYIRLRGEWGFNPRTMGDLNQNYFSITKI